MNHHQAAYDKYAQYCRDVVGIEPMSFQDWMKQRGWNLSDGMNTTIRPGPRSTLGTPGGN